MASAASRSLWPVRPSSMAIDCSRSKPPTSMGLQACAQSTRFVVVATTRKPSPRGTRSLRSSSLRSSARSTLSKTTRRSAASASSSALRQRCARVSGVRSSVSPTPMRCPSSDSPSRTLPRDSALTHATSGHSSSTQRAATAAASWDFPQPCIPTSTVRGAEAEKTARNRSSCSRLVTKPSASIGRLPKRMREGRTGTGASGVLTALAIMSFTSALISVMSRCDSICLASIRRATFRVSSVFVSNCLRASRLNREDPGAREVNSRATVLTSSSKRGSAFSSTFLRNSWPRSLRRSSKRSGSWTAATTAPPSATTCSRRAATSVAAPGNNSTSRPCSVYLRLAPLTAAARRAAISAPRASAASLPRFPSAAMSRHHS